MGGAKKRREPIQSSTLYDFFPSRSVKKRRYGSNILSTQKRAVSGDDGVPEDVVVISDDEQFPQDESRPCVASGSLTYPSVEIRYSGTTVTQPKSHELFNSNGLLDDSVVEIRDVFEPPLYEDWEMGDDEDVASQENEDIDMEDPKTHLCVAPHPNVDYSCPLCGQTLEGLFQSEIDRHVNSCIDVLDAPVSTMLEVKERPLFECQASLPPPASPNLKRTSAFSVLMSSYKEHSAWKEASEAENQKRNSRRRRPAPFYKVMQGMPIAVDAFRYGKIPGVTAYFLSHAHSDHYTNLSSSWKNGPIYCSQITADLIIHILDVDPKWVHPLPMDEPTVIPNTCNVEVTLIQANHCPGSVLFLFKGMQTVNAGDSTFQSPFIGSQRIFRYLHCGDFRACPQQVLHSEIKDKKIDTVYLDTTYLDPKYCFPPQSQVISACAELARRLVKGINVLGESSRPDENAARDRGLTGWVTVSNKGKEKQGDEASRGGRPLVVVGTYTIGKERIVKAIARMLSTKVYCDARKAAVLRCLADPELHAMLTSDPYAAGVHLVPLHVISSDTFKEYLAKWKGHWNRAVGFRPTGWTYTPPAGVDTLPNFSHVIARDQARIFNHSHLRQMRNSTPTLLLYGVPYSEHSSFFELTCFALSLDWGKMIATVNVGSQKSRAGMAKWFEKWKAERNKREESGGEGMVKYRQLDYW